MACNCNVSPQLIIPPDNIMATMTTVQIRQIANAHDIGPLDGSTPEGGRGLWRATQKKDVIIASLIAHRSGVAPTTSPAAAPSGGTLENELRRLMIGFVPQVDEATLVRLVDAAVDRAKQSFITVQVVLPSGETQNMGRQHHSFPILTKLVGACHNVLMVGPAGSGKTTAAVTAARSLQRDFDVVSVGPQTMQSELSGFRDATGTYRESAVRRRFSNGGVLIVDEFDAGNAGVLTYLNAILDNQEAGFPDGTASRHNHFSAVACANTWGTGADMLYVGRNQLDAATLDRFVVLEWNYDESFEMDLALAAWADAKPWVEQIHKWRKNMFTHKIRHVISPRASIVGAALLRSGMPQKSVEKMVVFKGLNKEAVDKIRQGA